MDTAGALFRDSIESGRGCPYGCGSAVTDSLAARSPLKRSVTVNSCCLSSVLATTLAVSVFFIATNFAINVKRTKSLLRDIIAAGAQLPWSAQISANLLRDEELVDLIAASGAKWIFIGMESIDPANLADVNKSFKKPGEYAAVLNRLAKRNVYAITSFIIGLDNDIDGVADRTLAEIASWPPGLPVFGPTPLPGTPLYNRLGAEGRLTRPKHWLNYDQYKMAHTPLS
jgi:radical SAM superfamily enzyme YgiQ (UPF0313 family)